MFNIKRPAHSGLVPNQIKWKRLTQNEIDILQNYLSYNTIQSLQKKVDAQPTKLIGYYRSTGVSSVFIKVLSKQNHQSQTSAEKIASWLHHVGLSVNCVRDGFPKKIVEHSSWIFAYDYIDYKFSNTSKEELFSIGKEIGHMHRLMKEYPDRENVRMRGAKKNQILFEQLNKVKLDRVSLNFSESAIKLIKETSDSDYQLLTLGAQMIHGDMNYGNVLFNKVNNQPIIIDFEDATTAWLSPLYDLAFVIQRFILLHGHKDSYELASALIRGYKSQNTLSKTRKLNTLFIMIKMISIRSLLILSMLPKEEQMLYLDEVDKFVYLYGKAHDDFNLISDIDDLIN